MKTYTKINKLYVAQSIKIQEQQMVMSVIDMQPQGASTAEMSDLISSNQKGQKLLISNEKEKDWKGQIATKILQPLRTVQNIYDVNASPTYQTALVDTAWNYAKLLAQKDHTRPDGKSDADLSDIDMSPYIDKASKLYLDAYKRRTGENWDVCDNLMDQPLSDKELDILATHVIDRGYEKF